MASRTVERFNAASETEGRGKVVTWCPSCHMHMSDIMAPGNTVAFDITHISELLVASIDRLAPLLTAPVPRRVLLHHEQARAIGALRAERLGRPVGIALGAIGAQTAPLAIAQLSALGHRSPPKPTASCAC